jgi:hypothetical protein
MNIHNVDLWVMTPCILVIAYQTKQYHDKEDQNTNKNIVSFHFLQMDTSDCNVLVPVWDCD